MSSVDQDYMRRCLQLAHLGAGQVMPNPMVGAVLVHEGRIIGEGYHRQYGGPHAEPNCINSVKEADRALIASSTLYVSLEPCAHFGKTPPCADLIIRMQIPRVVVGCRDPFPAVNGKGIEKLRAAGVEVSVGIEEQSCLELNKRFFHFHTKHRPYIILKWAQTANGLVGMREKRIAITGSATNILVHKWRSEEAAIAVGQGTLLADDPQLTTRLYPGRSPLRVLFLGSLETPSGLKAMDEAAPTLIYRAAEMSLQDAMQDLYERGVLSILIEGGPSLQQSFIEEGLWDEARVLTNTAMVLNDGVRAPLLKGAEFLNTESIGHDTITYYRKSIDGGTDV